MIFQDSFSKKRSAPPLRVTHFFFAVNKLPQRSIRPRLEQTDLWGILSCRWQRPDLWGAQPLGWRAGLWRARPLGVPDLWGSLRLG